MSLKKRAFKCSVRNDDGELEKIEVDGEKGQTECTLSIVRTNKTPQKEIVLNGRSEVCRCGRKVIIGDVDLTMEFESEEKAKLFRQFVDFRDESGCLFDRRTEVSSADQYFQFYGYLSQQQNMMQDYIRTGTYQKAMVQNFVDFKDKVVLDVGAGSGILSFFAMQAGAEKVYAVEASSMAIHTEKLVSSSQYAGRIKVIASKIEEVELPEKVDMIISEPMGYMLYNERMLETFIHARKFLKEDGLMFPSIGDLHVAPFTDEALYMEQFQKANFWYQQSFHGVDLSSLRDDAVAEYFKQPIVDTFDISILMAKSVKYSLDFKKASEEDLHVLDIPVKFQVHTSGTIHGLAFWFDVAFCGSYTTVWLSTAPNQPLTHWYQVRCLFRTPLFAKAGEFVTGRVLMKANKRQSYDIEIEASIDETGCKADNTLDLKNPYFRYNGATPQPTPGSNTSPSNEMYSGLNISLDSFSKQETTIYQTDSPSSQQKQQTPSVSVSNLKL
ncbi:unnamed protein product [Oikopleura dioica]|uniref:Histone-arginine methyltransferase CARM1 n=2 Tax=Oikopleura dioica TaxID=34765 RepID=E4XF46_OIKDI|nr:unnamed protein product [Oikopleura dioica]